MKLLLCFNLLLMAGCTASGSSSLLSVGTGGHTFTRVNGNNVMDVFVSDSTHCGQNIYDNEPCVTVHICEVGSTTQCLDIPNILLDTGSFGLRIFSSLVTSLNLNPVMIGANKLAECAQFGTNNDWGPVVTADVVLGGENPVTIPIQLINSSFATVPTSCTDIDTSPSTAGFNGILGVGLKKYDCGNNCTSSTSSGLYYACSGSTCNPSTVPLAKQVLNPVAAQTTDNNGVILTLGSVSSGGEDTASGQLILGIGTQSNNGPPNTITAYQANAYDVFQTTIHNLGNSNTTSMSAFLDSGSNGLFFPSDTNTPMCSRAQGFFCPSNTLSFIGSISDTVNTATINFNIAHAEIQFSSGNHVFVNVGGDFGLNQMDWGIPFFYGRTVFVQLENTTSPLGTGPLWGF